MDTIIKNPGRKSSVLLFILWPAGSFMRIFRHYRASWAPDIFWFFTIFLGFTFILGGDSVRMRQDLIMMHNSDFGLSDIFAGYLNADTGMLDIVFSLVTFIISRFTDDYRVLLSALSILFGFFLSRMIWFIIDHSQERLTFFTSLVLISFALAIGMWDVHGRWNIAAAIFVFGILTYLIEGRNKLFWIFVLAFLTHWIFFIAIGLFLIYKILGNRPVLFFSIFLASFVFSQIELGSIRDLFEKFAPDPVIESRSSYFSEYYLRKVGEGISSTNWYVWGHRIALNWYIFAIVCYIFIYKIKEIKAIPGVFSLFNFGMFFYGMTNSLTSVPSMHRFLVIGNLMMLAFLFLWMNKYKGTIPSLFGKAGIVVLLLFIIVRIRIGFDYIGLWTIIGNPATVWFTSNDLSLINIIKSFL